VIVCSTSGVQGDALAGAFSGHGAIAEAVASRDEVVERIADDDVPEILVFVGDDADHLHALVGWARSNAALADSVIVALTDEDPAHVASLYRDGADVALSMPADPDVLTAAATAATRRRR
jgi:DNA-binding NarL/FixJ family response regulator